MYTWVLAAARASSTLIPQDMKHVKHPAIMARSVTAFFTSSSCCFAFRAAFICSAWTLRAASISFSWTLRAAAICCLWTVIFDSSSACASSAWWSISIFCSPNWVLLSSSATSSDVFCNSSSFHLICKYLTEPCLPAHC